MKPQSENTLKTWIDFLFGGAVAFFIAAIIVCCMATDFDEVKATFGVLALSALALLVITGILMECQKIPKETPLHEDTPASSK